MQDPKFPKRKKLPHEIPAWVKQGAKHFITINCKKRGSSELIEEGVAENLLEGGRVYEELGKWYLWLMLVMPDHVHCIASFDLAQGIKPRIKAWKSFQRKALDIDWQSDFFEHRLRDDGEFEEKAHYIRMNPVRAGLVGTPQEWPFVIDRTDLERRSGEA